MEIRVEVYILQELCVSICMILPAQFFEDVQEYCRSDVKIRSSMISRTHQYGWACPLALPALQVQDMNGGW